MNGMSCPVCLYIFRYVYNHIIIFLFVESLVSLKEAGGLGLYFKVGISQFLSHIYLWRFLEERGQSGTMIFIVSWCFGGLAMVVFILFWQGSYTLTGGTTRAY